MRTRTARCVMVEMPLSSDDPSGRESQPRDLLPWADPYIVRLLAKHRLQAALEDSWQFAEDEAAGWHHAPDPSRRNTTSRFDDCRPQPDRLPPGYDN